MNLTGHAADGHHRQSWPPVRRIWNWARLDLNRVELNIGAGEMKVDLRGEPTHDYTVQVRGGVGETVVYLPKDVGIAATATKGLGDISTDGPRKPRRCLGESRSHRRAGDGASRRQRRGGAD